MAWKARRTRTDDEAIRSLREEIASLRAEVTSHLARLDETHRQSAAASERIEAVEANVSRLGAELARQLHELGDDIERIAEGTSDGAVTAKLDELRATQVRLANEQARYEIAFREDLSRLADDLRRRP